MLKTNQLRKYALVFCSVIGILSCSNNDEQTSSDTNQILARTSSELSESNEILETFKKNFNVKVGAEVILVDDDKPVEFNHYLDKIDLNLSDESIYYTTHIKIKTDNELEKLDVFTIKYKAINGDVRTMIVIENDYFDNTVIYDGKLEATLNGGQFKDLNYYEIENPNFVVNKVRFSTKCFKSCMGGVMSSELLWIGFAAGGICPPCGAASSVIAGAMILGCTGGCFVTVW